MYNELFSIGPLTFYGYGLMIAIAIIAAYIATEIRVKRVGLDQSVIYGLVVWAAIGGLLGAKILYLIVELPNIIDQPNFWENVATGFVVYGGIIGGIFTGYLYCRRKKLIFLDYFDLAMPSIALAQGFGRIGCFLAGCCYGVETDSCIGIVFHNSDIAPNNVSLVPTQLLSSGLNFIHFFILIIFAKHKKARGQVAALYLTLYSIGRYIMEMFRGDLNRGSVGQFSTSQFISIILVVVGIALFIVVTLYAKKHPNTQSTTIQSNISAAAGENQSDNMIENLSDNVIDDSSDNDIGDSPDSVIDDSLDNGSDDSK